MQGTSDAYILNDDLAKRLRALRLRRTPRLSQERLAELLQVSRATLANYENGRVAIPMWFVISAAKYFGVSINDLLTDGAKKG